MAKQGLRMAAAQKSDVKRLYFLYNVLENVFKYDGCTPEEFDHFEEDEKKQLSEIFEDGEINYEYLGKFLYDLTHGFHRVVMGYEVLFENTADPTLSFLDFNENIKTHFGLVEIMGEDLRAKGSIVITSDSETGKKILELTKEDQDEATTDNPND